MENLLSIVHGNIEQTLKNSYATTTGLALTIDDNGNPKNFNEVGKQLLSYNNSIDAVQLVPGGVIKYTYPLKGNEAAMNYNILTSPLHKDAALKAIQIRKMYYVGPVELQQGGLGIVGRLPVYKKEKFWGFSAVVIRFSTFMQAAGISTTKDNRFFFELSKINPDTKVEKFFLNEDINFKSKAYKSISIPEGDWKLYIVEKNGNALLMQFFPVFFLTFIVSILSGFFVNMILRRPYELENLVKIQTERIIKNELLFKSLFEHAGLGITHTDSVNGTFIEANEKFCAQIGYSHHEIKIMDYMMITHLDDLESDLKQMERLRNGEIEGFSLEKRYFHKNGSIIWVNITVSPLWSKGEKPTSHMTIVEDITKRKQAEKELLQSRQKIESLINSVDGIVWEGYPDKPGVTFVSKKCEDILGYSAEEWINDDNFWYDHIHPDDREWVMQFSKECAEQKRPHIWEYRMINREGNILWMRDIVSVFIEDDDSFKFRGILIDISKTKQFEIDLNNSLQLVTEQNKRLMDFSHIVSHNLRSHTSNIDSLTNLIEESDDEAEKKELIGLLKKVSETLNETMDNLNEVVSIQTEINHSTEWLNLRENIVKTEAILSNQIVKKEAKIINSIDNSVRIKYNAAYLESILLNLISNALRYAHPERNPVIELTCYEENNYLVLSVKDNGIGIDLNKNKNKLFGMYKTFTDNPESKGIGLFITKNQIDTMQGKIEVESELNIGTTFKVFFKR
ncbi:PAS domain S-box protein [Flavobacterium sp.]|uniref:PAS domain S-box protein n=1 Tax=Flavobacterium sp. TaxID=239 RepID=UPI0028BD4573|nr:PAS domain S-box protein [Flavobacterium sp.]